jgi:hypothetical protein
MRNLSKALSLLALVSATSLGTVSHGQVLWQVGLDDDAWPAGNGGGPNTSFVQENGTINPLPGNPANPETDQQGDNDYYFAGLYNTILSGAYVPVGPVLANEEGAERAFAAADNDLRYHFNLPPTLRPFDLLSVTFDAFNLDTDGIADPRYGIELYFNGVLVQTQIVIRPAQLGTDFTSPQFTLASVNAQTGPGFDNIVSLRGVNYSTEGGGNWMGIDYVQLQSTPGVGLLPGFVNIGGNKIGSLTNNGDGSITIVGGGNDIWDGRDEFSFAYTEVTGDFDVQVRVASLTANGTHSKAGLMVRESLSEFSRMAFPRVTPDQAPGVNDVKFAYRTGLDNVSGVNGGQHEDGGGTPNNIPNAWLRLSRIGSVLYSSNSVDGVNWTLLGSQDTTTWGGGALSNRVYLGLAVARNGAGPTATAVFDDFQFNTNGALFTVVGASSRGNPTGVRVTFNNPPGASAFTAGNYVLNTVSGPNVTVVTGLRFTTANDSPARDPMTFTLEGTLGDANTGPWTLIASGNTGLSTDRFATAPDVTFANSIAYKAYRILFPTVRDAVGANSMQIAEVAFLDAGGNDVTAPGDLVIPTSGNHPAGEPAPAAIDDNNNTKYLNFDKLNTGFVVAPTSGTAPAAPAVLNASRGSVFGTVQLTTTPLVEGATYELAVNNVQSEDGLEPENVLATFTHGAEFPLRRIHVTHNKTDDSGYYRNSDAVRNGIGDVIRLGDGVFPPVQSNTVFEDPTPDTAGNERFSSRMAGILRPPANGNYTFYVSSDDLGFLFLSSDHTPANKIQIAMEPQWNGPREYITGANQASRGTPPANISAPQTLAGGGRYYLEMVFTEGGGGNNASAAWLPPGGTPVANGSSPIPESAFEPSRLFGGQSFRTLGPVQIVSNPTNRTVTALTPTTFRVGVDGTPAYTFQWRRNGENIPGANDSSYTIPVTPLIDDGAVYSVLVGNEFSSAISAGATLTVLVPQSPHLTDVAADASFSRVMVTFDNRVLPATAQNTNNYSIPGVEIFSATRDATGRRVILATSPLAEGVSYSLTVSNIQDETGTTMLDPNPSTRNFTGWVFSPGFALMEVYPTGAGNAVSVLTSHPSYPNSPSARFFITAIDSRQGYPDDTHESYGGRISGLFIPPTNGNYIIALRSDDASELWASPNSSTAGLAKIAEQTACCNAFTMTPPLASVPLPLVAGDRYAYEVLWKEGTGGDFAQVSIDGINVVGPSMLGVYANPDAVSIIINQQPQSLTRDANGFAQFSIDATLTVLDGIPRTLLYQWRSNGVDIAGANGPVHIPPQLTIANNGDVYSVVVRAPGATVTSTDAVLTVQDDLTPPVLVSARGDGTFRRINLTYSEIMSEGPAIEPGNYILLDSQNNPITITTATWLGSNVVLDLASAMEASSIYTLELDFQSDLVGNGPDLVGNPTIDIDHGIVTNIATWVISPGFTRFSAFLNLTVPSNNDLTPLVTSPNYPNNPTFTFITNVVNWPQTVPDMNNYGMRFAGLFIAPETGSYKFEPAHDDGMRLYMSTNDNPADAVLVFNADCCTGFVASEAGYVVNLTAGQRIFFEALAIEAGGGDYLGLSVTLPSGAYLAPIPSRYLALAIDPAVGALNGAGIALQPASTVVQEPGTASFSVVVTNAGILGATYQWQVDTGGGFLNIPGAQSTNYTTPLLAFANNGTQYRVLVFVPGKTITSDAATVTVLQDVTNPVVLSARGTRNLNAIRLTFDGPLSSPTAEEISNYTLMDSNNAVVPLFGPVVLSADGRTVTIPTAPQNAGDVFTITVENIQDLAGNSIVTTNLTFQTFIWSRGFATADYFFNIGTGVTVPDLTNNPAYPNNPSMTEYVSVLEQRRNFNGTVEAQENYGTHMYAQLLPPTTDSYNFYMSSDDGGAVYLSTDASPANNLLIASEPGWNGVREFISGANQVSRGDPPANRSTTLFPAGISLTAGQAYYIEVLAKEGGGGDNSAVAFEFPGSLPVVNGSTPIHGTFLQALADPVDATISIVQQTTLTTTNLQHGGHSLLTVSAVGTNVNGSAPVVYQWQRREGAGPWTDIYGANSNTYLAASSANRTFEYRALVFIPGAQAVTDPVQVAGEMVLTWTDPGVLQSAPTILGPWTDITPAAISPFPVDTTQSQMQFFRLRPLTP